MNRYGTIVAPIAFYDGGLSKVVQTEIETLLTRATSIVRSPRIYFINSTIMKPKIIMITHLEYHYTQTDPVKLKISSNLWTPMIVSKASVSTHSH